MRRFNIGDRVVVRNIEDIDGRIDERSRKIVIPHKPCFLIHGMSGYCGRTFVVTEYRDMDSYGLARLDGESGMIPCSWSDEMLWEDDGADVCGTDISKAELMRILLVSNC